MYTRVQNKRVIGSLTVKTVPNIFKGCSVATCLTCRKLFSDYFVSNLLLILNMKLFAKSVRI